MASRLGRSFASFRRLVLLVAVFLFVAYVLRTPTAPWFEAGTPPPPPVNNKIPRNRLPEEWQEFLKWDIPTNDPEHYPPYNAYQDRDYDPNRWEAFRQNNGMYLNGTLKRLEDREQQPKPFQPYPEYNSAAWKSKWQGEYVPCRGPFDAIINTVNEPLTKAYEGVPEGFPMPDVGSWEALGIDRPVCFDRNSRLGPYGIGLGEQEKLDIKKTKWGKLQDECLVKNAARYEDPTVPSIQPGKNPISPRKSTGQKRGSRAMKPRSAVLIRTWDTYEYQENDIIAIRSLVTELSLQSGGEYHVFLLVNIKDIDVQIFSDQSVYAEYLEKYVPEELRDIAILWTEAVCQEWYPKIGEWSVYWQQFMPVQWFSRTHPEFEYIWNWEMDARLIGQHYHFFEKLGNFAKQQPRKYLWERNSRYYIPALHGSWARYFDDSNKQIEAAKVHTDTVWGPQPWSAEQSTSGPDPPLKEKHDNFQWGVDEDADLITLLPMWDPRETWWSYRDRLFNYPGSEKSSEERPFPDIPRRVFINTLVRFSSSLLDAMHYENEAGLSMASEMWPGSVALQHGLKAVYAPHPIWQSHIWDPRYMDLIFNADGWGAGSTPGHNIDDGRGVAYDRELEVQGKPQAGTGPNGEGRSARWMQERDCPYNPDREHNFAGWSWYFWSDFPRVLYWRWLGWKAGFSIVTIGGAEVRDELGMAGGHDWEKEHGRMCLPHMLLHPVKNVKPPD